MGNRSKVTTLVSFSVSDKRFWLCLGHKTTFFTLWFNCKDNNKQVSEQKLMPLLETPPEIYTWKYFGVPPPNFNTRLLLLSLSWTSNTPSLHLVVPRSRLVKRMRTAPPLLSFGNATAISAGQQTGRWNGFEDEQRSPVSFTTPKKSLNNEENRGLVTHISSVMKYSHDGIVIVTVLKHKLKWCG